MTTCKTFTDDLTAVVFAGVLTRFDDIPRELKASQLPAQFVDLPTISISPQETVSNYGSFSAAAGRYVVTLYIAVAEVTEGLPENQRTAILDMAEEVEAWAITTPWTVEIETKARIPVGSREYRGVVARVTADDMD